MCFLCLSILHQPLERILYCRASVCTDCMVSWYKVSNCSRVKCPCCVMDSPLTQAGNTYNTCTVDVLLMGIVVQCHACRSDVWWVSGHKCEDQPPSDTDVVTASCVLSKLVSNCTGLHWSQFQLALYTIDTYIHADHSWW